MLSENLVQRESKRPFQLERTVTLMLKLLHFKNPVVFNRYLRFNDLKEPSEYSKRSNSLSSPNRLLG